MRIFYVEFGLGFGGATISLAETIRGLHQSHEDFESVVLHFQNRDVGMRHFSLSKVINRRRRLNYITNQQFKEFLNKSKPPLLLKRSLSLCYRATVYLYELFESVAVFAQVKRIRPDVIHSNNGWDRIVTRAARWTGIPLVVHIRGFAASDYRIPAIDIRSTDVCLCISQPVAAAVHRYGMPAEKTFVVHNPVTLEDFEAAQSNRPTIRSQYGIEPHQVVVAIFGRIVPWKGQLEFLRAVKQIIADAGDLVVMLVGDGADLPDEEYQLALENLASEIREHIPVVFSGFQPNVQDYYAACDIVVHASIEPEPFGRVIIEGMASKRAVIGMDEGGPPEIISDGENGLLVEPRNVDALSSAILNLYRDQNFRNRLGRSGMDTITSHFTPQQTAKSIYSHYLKLLMRDD